MGRKNEMPQSIVTAISNFFYGAIYLLWRMGAWIVNLIEDLFRMLVGLNPVQSGVNDDKDITNIIIENRTVQQIFLNLVAFATIMLIFFTILQIIREHYKDTKTGGNPYILVFRMVKAMVLFMFVTTACIVGLQLSQVVLRALDSATGRDPDGGIGGVIFGAMAGNANRVAQGAESREAIADDNSYAASIAYNTAQEWIWLEDLTELQIYYGGDPDSDKYDDEDYAYGEIVDLEQAAGSEYTGAFKWGVRFDMTDLAKVYVGGNSYSNEAEGYANPVLSFLTGEDVRVRFHLWIVDKKGKSRKVSRDYQWWKHLMDVFGGPGGLLTGYMFKDNDVSAPHTGFTMGPRLLEDGGDYRYFGIDMNPVTGKPKASLLRQFGLMSGSFFYVDDGKGTTGGDSKSKNKPLLYEYYNRFVYYNTETKVTGRANQKFPDKADPNYVKESDAYINWINDMMKRRRNVSEKLFMFDSQSWLGLYPQHKSFGEMRYTQTSAVLALYSIKDFNWIIGFGGLFIALGVYNSFAFGMIQRIAELGILYMFSPVTLAFFPFDDGQRFNSTFVQPFYKKAISSYAPVLSLNLFFVILPAFDAIRWFESGALNALAGCIVSIALLSMLPKVRTTIQTMLGADPMEEKKLFGKGGVINDTIWKAINAPKNAVDTVKGGLDGLYKASEPFAYVAGRAKAISGLHSQKQRDAQIEKELDARVKKGEFAKDSDEYKKAWAARNKELKKENSLGERLKRARQNLNKQGFQDALNRASGAVKGGYQKLEDAAFSPDKGKRFKKWFGDKWHARQKGLDFKKFNEMIKDGTFAKMDPELRKLFEDKNKDGSTFISFEKFHDYLNKGDGARTAFGVQRAYGYESAKDFVNNAADAAKFAGGKAWGGAKSAAHGVWDRMPHAAVADAAKAAGKRLMQAEHIWDMPWVLGDMLHDARRSLSASGGKLGIFSDIVSDGLSRSGLGKLMKSFSHEKLMADMKEITEAKKKDEDMVGDGRLETDNFLKEKGDAQMERARNFAANNKLIERMYDAGLFDADGNLSILTSDHNRELKNILGEKDGAADLDKLAGLLGKDENGKTKTYTSKQAFIAAQNEELNKLYTLDLADGLANAGFGTNIEAARRAADEYIKFSDIQSSDFAKNFQETVANYQNGNKKQKVTLKSGREIVISNNEALNTYRNDVMSDFHEAASVADWRQAAIYSKSKEWGEQSGIVATKIAQELSINLSNLLKSFDPVLARLTSEGTCQDYIVKGDFAKMAYNILKAREGKLNDVMGSPEEKAYFEKFVQTIEAAPNKSDIWKQAIQFSENLALFGNVKGEMRLDTTTSAYDVFGFVAQAAMTKHFKDRSANEASKYRNFVDQYSNQINGINQDFANVFEELKNITTLANNNNFQLQDMRTKNTKELKSYVADITDALERAYETDKAAIIKKLGSDADYGHLLRSLRDSITASTQLAKNMEFYTEEQKIQAILESAMSKFKGKGLQGQE